jgi:hypothetical protein
MISLVEFWLFASLGTLTAAGASRGYHRLRRHRHGTLRSSIDVRLQGDEGRPPAGAWHEPRWSARYRLSCRIEYIQDDLCSLGMLVDISKNGWRVTGQRAAAKGAVMSVNLFLPDEPMPVMIEQATVRWTDGLEFGLGLNKMRPEEAARLSDYLASRFPASQETVSPFSPYAYN